MVGESGGRRAVAICAQFAPSHSHVWLLGSAIEIWLVMPPNNTVRPRAKSFAMPAASLPVGEVAGVVSVQSTPS